MSLDVETLCEAYSTLKAYIPAKDRQEASDALMGALVEFLDDGDLKEFGGTDRYTKNSLSDHVDDYEDEEYDEY
jgi:hypothetical protein